MKNSSKAKKSSKLSMTNVRKVLSQAAFNPREPGPLNVVANSGNPSYFETRAIEYIAEAGIDRMNLQGLPPDNITDIFQNHAGKYKHNLTRAIQMLTIAILKVEDGET